MNNSTPNSSDNKIAIYERAVGLDIFGALALDPRIRRGDLVGTEEYASLVDLMTIFAPENNDPRIYWSQEKKRLLSKDNELYQSVIQLKMVAQDGKRRSTDCAPMWACIFIVLLMDTPMATQFKKAISKNLAGRSIENIRYRSMTAAKGSEWAADSIHQTMLNAGLFDDTSDLYEND